MEGEVITKQAVLQVLKDYWGQYRAHPWYAGASFILPAIGTVLVFFVPPLIVARILDTFATQGVISLSAVWGYIPLFGGLWLLGEALWRLAMHFLCRLEERGLNNLTRSAFQKIVSRDYAFYANNFVGSLTTKTMAFGRGFETFTDTLIFNVTTNILPIFFAVIILWQYSPWIPLVLTFLVIGTICIVLPIIKRRSKLVALRHEASSRMAGRVSDSMTNMLAIKSFAKEEKEYSAFGEYVDDFTAKFKKAGDYQDKNIDTLLSCLYVAINICGMFLAIFFAQKLSLQPGAIMVVFSYYALVTRIFWDVNRTYRNIESSVGEAAEFTEMFLTAPAIQDNAGAKPLQVKEACVQFKNISFKYEDNTAGQPAFLNRFNLEIKSKQKVGLVGLSGGGKTTITKLLLRFMDVQNGSITIDGQDIKNVTQASLHKALAYVPQESLLFHRSLFENIAYGNDAATEKDVEHVATLAHADEFIDQLPQRYQTFVGERGIKLSGGQRQRVAIARALLKEAPILVLDEATSSLDSESEHYIQEGLWELMKDKTALIIAHRLSTIKHLDRIVVLDNGKIVEDGTHKELIKQKGLYAKLWSRQSGEFLRT